MTRLDHPLTFIVEVPHGYRVYGATHTWAGTDEPLWMYLGYTWFRRRASRSARRWIRDEHVDRAVGAALDRSMARVRGETGGQARAL